MQAQSECLIHALGVHGTDDTAPVRRRLEWDLPELTKAMVQSISQLETAGRLDYLAIRLRRVTPTLKLLCGLSSLRSLDLSHTKMTDEDLSRLERCHNLVKLDVSYSSGVTYFSPISEIKTLEVVKLSKCYRLVGVGYLGELPCLKTLELRHTLIEDEVLLQLCQSKTLVKIDLYSCALLKNANLLSSIATLEVINLSRCTSLTHVGALSKLPTLKEVDLSKTRITDEEIRQLSECHTLVNINLHSCYWLTNVNPLSIIETLEVINLTDCYLLTHVGALGKFPALKEVYLSRTPITDEDVRVLSESKTLVNIDLHWCEALTDVNPLSSIATLEVINLSKCTSLIHVGALGKLPALKEVNLWSTGITDDDVDCLVSLRQQLGLPSIDIIVDRNSDDFANGDSDDW